jgi:SAM-dependent methyltransferase
MDTPKDCFIKAWGIGYVEQWPYTMPVSDFIKTTVTPFCNKQHVALEVGCGRGVWTQNCLSPNFKKVICLDVIPKSDWIAQLPNVEYIELPDRNFSCLGVADNSVDFVWSFGCFCHLTMDAVREYLKSLFRVTKRGANLVCMFGNWQKHPNLIQVDKGAVFPPDQCPWFYQDLELVKQAILDAGFMDFVDLVPEVRDTIVHFKKPPSGVILI